MLRTHDGFTVQACHPWFLDPWNSIPFLAHIISSNYLECPAGRMTTSEPCTTGSIHSSISCLSAVSGWPPDNYSAPFKWPGYQDKDWREIYKGHPCFDPNKVQGCLVQDFLVMQVGDERAGYQECDWSETYKGHPCFNSNKVGRCMSGLGFHFCQRSA